MKSISCFIILSVLFACAEENNTPTTPVKDSFMPISGQSTLLKEGTLTGANHSVSGSVKLYEHNGKKYILLDPFSSENGPDLKVYLSTDENASRYINLGSLQSVTGKQSYEVSGKPDFNEYSYILVWCQEFSVLFGKARLQ